MKTPAQKLISKLKNDLPSITHKLSDGRVATIRPFTIKEMKLVMDAMLDKSDVKSIEILNNCIAEDIDLNELPFIEVEQILLGVFKLTKNNPLIDAIFVCTNVVDGISCENKNDVKLNLNNVVINDTTAREIKISDDITLVMKLPTAAQTELFETGSITGMFNLTMNCIKEIRTPADVLVVGTDITKEEVVEVIDYMDEKAIDVICNWFKSLPTMQLHFPITCSKCGHEEIISLTGLDELFY